MSRRKFSILPQIILLILLPGILYAQQSTAGNISGQILDAMTGQPLPGASLVLKGTFTGTVADFDGNYEIANVPTGSYTVEASFIGFKTAEEFVVVTGNSTTTQDFNLKTDYSQSGNINKVILINISLFAIALIYLGVFTHHGLKPILTFTIPKILLPVSIGFLGVLNILDLRFDVDLASILGAIVGAACLTFSLSVFLRKRINETALILAGALIFESIITFLFILFAGYLSIFEISFHLTNFILAGGTLAFAGVYAKIESDTSIAQKL